MQCAVCHHELQELHAGEPTCPACGRPERMADAPEAARVVEGSIEPAEGTQLAYMPRRDVSSPENHSLVLAAPVQTALAALARLPALAWQQPAVRSAVTTGASALAMTVALRIAARMLASQGGRQVARQVAGESLLPALAELLQRGEARPAPTRRGRSREVSETFIYLRRTVRQ